MKIAFVLLSIGICMHAGAQVFPSNAEVYNFAVGDTFVYQVSDEVNMQNGNLLNEHFDMMVVIGRQDGGDSTIYTFRNCFDFDSLHNYLFCDTVVQVIHEDTSTVSCFNSYFPLADNCYCNQGGIAGPYYNRPGWGDSIWLSDSTLYWGGECTNAGGGGWDIEAVKGLGIVFISGSCISGNIPEGEYQYCNLVYYHLTNGLIGGISNYYILGINNLATNKNSVQVVPNPATNQFTINISPFLQQEEDFKLFDVTGRMVLNQKLTSSNTTIERKKWDNGIYFWRINISGETVQTGNLVLE